MIENILYEIDNAYNESENNVLEAIQESCYKALEILENTDDDRDVECFGVFQEAVATATMEKPETKTDKSTNNDEKTDSKNKKEDQKIEKVVTIDPRVAAAAEKFKADKKKKTEENLSKLATVNAKKYDKAVSFANAVIRFCESKAVKISIKNLIIYPQFLRAFADEFEKCLSDNSNKVTQESVTEDSQYSVDAIEKAVELIRSNLLAGRSTSFNSYAYVKAIAHGIVGTGDRRMSSEEINELIKALKDEASKYEKAWMDCIGKETKILEAKQDTLIKLITVLKSKQNGTENADTDFSRKRDRALIYAHQMAESNANLSHDIEKRKMSIKRFTDKNPVINGLLYLEWMVEGVKESAKVYSEYFGICSKNKCTKDSTKEVEEFDKTFKIIAKILPIIGTTAMSMGVAYMATPFVYTAYSSSIAIGSSSFVMSASGVSQTLISDPSKKITSTALKHIGQPLKAGAKALAPDMVKKISTIMMDPRLKETANDVRKEIDEIRMNVHMKGE